MGEENVSQETGYSSSDGARQAAPAKTRALTPARAKTVETAFWLLIAAAVLVLVRIPVGMWAVDKDEHKKAIEDFLGPDNVPIWTGNEVSEYIWAGVITALILTAIAVLSRMGLGWPRIVLIVVAVFTALNARVQFFASVIPVYETAWVTLISVLLTLAATVLLFLKPSNDYFKAIKQHRKGKALNPA